MSVDTLQRFGLKLFLQSGQEVDPKSLIPVFHRWIQTGAVGGLLIDVADYTHLAEGPSVLLVGHEGNYAFDYRDGRPGLYYYRKRPAAGPLADRLVALARVVLEATHLLEVDDALGPDLRFSGNELELVTNDRLLAPAIDEVAEALRPALASFLDRLYPGEAHDVSHATPDGDRLTFTLRSASEVTVRTLLSRIK